MRPLFSFSFLPLILYLFCSPGTAHGEDYRSLTPPPALVAESAMAVQAGTGRVLYQKNIDEMRPVASTQKLLTALIIAESGNLDSAITVQRTDGMIEPRNLWITSGSRYRKGKLLEMMLVRSFNDVTKCLARSHAGSQGDFARVMQDRAAQLGMRDSVFLNAHGLTVVGQYSNARDMMLLARAAWSNPVLRRIMATRETTFTYHGGETIPIRNSNNLIHTYPECRGMKTGYTRAAGRCLICAAEREGVEVLAVILGSTEEGIWTDSESLLRWGLDNLVRR